MNKTFLLIILLLLNINIFSQESDTTRLEIDQQLERHLTTDEKHIYMIDLNAKQFVNGKVNQKGVNLIISISDPLGKQIAKFNMIAGQEGFYIETTDEGPYRIEVLPLFFGGSSANSGEYFIEIIQSEPLGNTPQKQIDQFLNALYFSDGSGGAIAVINDGKIIYSTAYGMANLTHMNPFTTETLSNIGSVSKQFTAFAIALLEKRGKLSFDDDIRTYIPECPDFGQTVTIRNLLNHTSGYREIKRTFGMKGIRGFWVREELIQQIQKQRELQFSPGSEYNYTNTNYILLAEVVESISGISFREWMKINIFDPLDMEYTSVNSPIYAQIQRVVPNSADGYIKIRGEYGHFIDEQAFYGASSIFSTIGDLSKWLQNFDSAGIGGEELLSQMVTPAVLTNGDTIDYAFGLYIDKHNGLLRYSHDGFDGLHWTELSYYPELNAGIIILNNNWIFPKVSSKLSEVFFGDFMKSEEPSVNQDSEEKKYHEVDPALLDAYVGRYSTEEDERNIVTIERKGNELRASVVSSLLLPSSFDLHPDSDSTFYNESIDVSIIFHLDTNNQVKHANFKYYRDFILHPLPIYKPSNEDLMAFSGLYYSPELQSVFTIIIEDNRLQVTIPNGMSIKLEPKYSDTFTGENYGEYRFKRNADGDISEFVVQNVHFKKLK